MKEKERMNKRMKEQKKERKESTINLGFNQLRGIYH